MLLVRWQPHHVYEPQIWDHYQSCCYVWYNYYHYVADGAAELR